MTHKIANRLNLTLPKPEKFFYQRYLFLKKDDAHSPVIRKLKIGLSPGPGLTRFDYIWLNSKKDF